MVRHSDGTVSGSKHLKATQTYPLMFGTAIAVAAAAHAKAVATATDATEEGTLEFAPPTDEQGDARLWAASCCWWLRDVLGHNKECGDARLPWERS